MAALVLACLDDFSIFPALLPAKTAGIERTDEEIVMMAATVESFMVAVSCLVELVEVTMISMLLCQLLLRLSILCLLASACGGVVLDRCNGHIF